MNKQNILDAAESGNILGEGYELTVNQTRAFLRDCVMKESDGSVFVEYNGNMLELCREDDLGEVRTKVSAESGQYELLRAEIALDCLCGARVEDGMFIVVDSLTDG